MGLPLMPIMATVSRLSYGGSGYGPPAQAGERGTDTAHRRPMAALTTVRPLPAKAKVGTVHRQPMATTVPPMVRRLRRTAIHIAPIMIRITAVPLTMVTARPSVSDFMAADFVEGITAAADSTAAASFAAVVELYAAAAASFTAIARRYSRHGGGGSFHGGGAATMEAVTLVTTSIARPNRRNVCCRTKVGGRALTLAKDLQAWVDSWTSG